MARASVVLWIGLGLIAAAPAASVLAADHDCTCRVPGGRVELGGTVCLATPTGPRLARCEMDQNITSWKILDTACSVSLLPQDRTRFAPANRVAAATPSQ